MGDGSSCGAPPPLPDVDAAGRHRPSILARGRDFYMQPAWSPDETKLCWIAWDHPQMPWDGTYLEMATVEYADGRPPRLRDPRPIAGGTEIAIFQPEFSRDGHSLLYISDESGWGRLAMRSLADGTVRWLTPPEAMDAARRKDITLRLPTIKNLELVQSGGARADEILGSLRGRAVLSNTSPLSAYRSAGRPQVMFVIERLIDLAARRHGFDRVALRGIAVAAAARQQDLDQVAGA